MALKTQRSKNTPSKGRAAGGGADVYQDGTAGTGGGEGESFEPSKPSGSDLTKGKKAPGKRGRQVGHEV